MNKRIAIGAALAALLALHAQAVFAATPYDADFATALQKNDVPAMEKLLQRRASQMSLSTCLLTVFYNNWGGGDLNTNYRNNTLAITELLVRYGANLNRPTNEYFSKSAKNRPQLSTFAEPMYPLHYAVTNNIDMAVVKYLIEYGANPNLKSEKGITSLEHAIREKNDALVTLMLTYGVTIDSGAFFRAISNNNLTLVTTCLEKGTDINMRGTWKTPAGTAYIANGTVLMDAAYNGNLDMIKFLMANGARVNLRDDNGATAASLAYAKGEVEIYNYLKENGAIDF
jgi:ankyrin repeat protein